MSTDAIVILKNDHKQIRRSFKQFQSAGESDTARKDQIVKEIIEALTVFPKVREGLGRKQLQELGARMNDLREKAPRSPAQPSALRKAVDAVTA